MKQLDKALAAVALAAVLANQLQAACVVNAPGTYTISSIVSTCGGVVAGALCTLNDVIQIDADVTVDGEGKTLTGANTDHGIEKLAGGYDLTIHDLTIDGKNNGIRDTTATGGDLTLTNVTVENCVGSGIAVFRNGVMTFSNVVSQDNAVAGLLANDPGAGTLLDSFSCIGNGDSGVYARAQNGLWQIDGGATSNVYISGNKMTGSVQEQVSLQFLAVIRNSEIVANGVGVATRRVGINIEGAVKDQQATGNSITDGSYAIDVSGDSSFAGVGSPILIGGNTLSPAGFIGIDYADGIGRGASLIGNRVEMDDTTTIRAGISAANPNGDVTAPTIIDSNVVVMLGNSGGLVRPGVATVGDIKNVTIKDNVVYNGNLHRLFDNAPYSWNTLGPVSITGNRAQATFDNMCCRDDTHPNVDLANDSQWTVRKNTLHYGKTGSIQVTATSADVADNLITDNTGVVVAPAVAVGQNANYESTDINDLADGVDAPLDHFLHLTCSSPEALRLGASDGAFFGARGIDGTDPATCQVCSFYSDQIFSQLCSSLSASTPTSQAQFAGLVATAINSILDDNPVCDEGTAGICGPDECLTFINTALGL